MNVQMSTWERMELGSSKAVLTRQHKEGLRLCPVGHPRELEGGAAESKSPGTRDESQVGRACVPVS